MIEVEQAGESVPSNNTAIRVGGFGARSRSIGSRFIGDVVPGECWTSSAREGRGFSSFRYSIVRSWWRAIPVPIHAARN